MPNSLHQDSKNLKLPPRILLSPGPTNANPRVLKAMSEPVMGYMDPEFISIIAEVSELLQELYQTSDGMTMAITGTGSAGMEAGFNNLLEPDDTVVMCVYGFFSERMIEMASRLGANVIPLRSDWGKPFPEEMLEDELSRHTDVKLVTAVHAETSTGVRQPLEGLSRLAKDHDALFMVDAVTSLGGSEVAFDKWALDYAYSATQKCLACPPGLSPVAISHSALKAISERTKPPTSWFLDLALLSEYWGESHKYHHTIPISNMLGLLEGLRIIMEEGLENRYARHRRNAAALRAGLDALGMKYVVEDAYRLDQITVIWIPEGIDDQTMRRALLQEYGIEIGQGLGQFAGKVWRIGLMGESSKLEYVMAFLSAIEKILPGLGYEAGVGTGVAAASRSFAAV